MKKTLILFLCGALTLGMCTMVLCGCGQNDTDDSAADNTAAAAADTSGDESSDASAAEQILSLPAGGELTIGEGTLKFFITDGDENGEYGNAHLSYGDSDVDLGFTEWMKDSYVLSEDDSHFTVLAQLGGSNDWTYTAMVAYDPDHGFTAYPQVDGAIDSVDCITGDTIVLDTRVDVFGTYGVTITYNITDEGLTSDQEYIPFTNKNQVEDGSFLDQYDSDEFVCKIYDENGRNILILAAPLTVTTDSGDVTLETGTVIYPVAYNPTEQNFYIESDDTEGYFHYETGEDGYSLTVNGVDSYEQFEEMPYAG